MPQKKKTLLGRWTVNARRLRANRAAAPTGTHYILLTEFPSSFLLQITFLILSHFGVFVRARTRAPGTFNALPLA